jgi:hypothetical protein
MRRTSVLVLVVACLVGVLLGTDRRIRAQVDRSPAPVPVRGAGAQPLSEAGAPSPSATDPAGTWTAPGRASMSTANRDHGQPQDGVAARRAATTLPAVDRSFDLRDDLRDMANSLRRRRGSAPDLPPGSSIAGTSAG